MYYMRKQFLNFVKISNSCLQYFNYCPMSDGKQVYAYSSGVLNLLWQSWNKFWKTFWLAYIMGGYDFSNKRTIPCFFCSDEREAIFYLLYCLGKRDTPKGKIKGTHQEPTWGDIDILQELSMEMPSPGNRILNAFSVLGNTPKHLQIVRNAAIHLDKDNMEKLKKTVIPYYVISKTKYPTEIIFAKDLSTGEIAIKKWIDELVAFLKLVLGI